MPWGWRHFWFFRSPKCPAAGKALQIELDPVRGKTRSFVSRPKLANERSVRVGLMLKGLEDKLLRRLQMCKGRICPAIGFGAAAGD